MSAKSRVRHNGVGLVCIYSSNQGIGGRYGVGCALASESAEEIRGQRVEIISGCAFDELKKGVGAEDALLPLLRGRCLECGVVSPGAIVTHRTFAGGQGERGRAAG